MVSILTAIMTAIPEQKVRKGNLASISKAGQDIYNWDHSEDLQHMVVFQISVIPNNNAVVLGNN